MNVTWETLAPPETTQVPPQQVIAPPPNVAPVDKRNVRHHLIRLIDEPLQNFAILDVQHRLALVEWVAEKPRYETGVDPIAVVPLFEVSSRFKENFKLHARLQEQYAAAGGNPGHGWQSTINRATEILVDELSQIATPAETQLFDQVMWAITSDPRKWIKVTTPFPTWGYAGIFLLTFVSVIGLAALFV